MVALTSWSAVFVAGACEVVAHVVEHRQVVDLDQAIAVMVGKVTPLKVLEVVDLQGGGYGSGYCGWRFGPRWPARLSSLLWHRR